MENVKTAGYSRSSLMMLKDMQPRKVVIDSSVPWYRMSFLEEMLGSLDLGYHNVFDDGAWILDLHALR